MQQYRIRRDKGLALVFKGEILADVTSKDDPAQQRWNEIRIYRTEQGRYVMEERGITHVPGEYSRCKAEVYDTPRELIEGLRRPARAHTTRNPEIRKRGWYFTDLALEAFDAAEERDPAFIDAASERV